MRKRLFIFVALVLGLFLAACQPSTPKEKPTFSGVDLVEINVGEAFDPKAGVTAKDYADKDITANIVVTGTVDVNAPGVYELTYTVKDSGGRETVKIRVVRVKGLGNLVNGNFADGLNGWAPWVNETQDVAADFSVANNEAAINITAQSIVKDNNWWDVQLSQKTIAFAKFESLKLVFTARAENQRKMMVNLQGGGMAQKAIADELISLTTENQTFEFEFFSKDDAENAELQFALGTFHKVDGVPPAEQVVLGKVYISNVKIVAGPALENQAPTITASNVLLRVGHEGFLTKQGVAVDDDRDKLTIEDVSVTDITVGTKFSSPAKKGVYTFQFSVTDSGGLTTTITRLVVVADPFEVPSFAEVDDDGVPLGWSVWYEDTRGGLEVSAENEVVTIDITKIGVPGDLGNVWENKFILGGLAPFEGTYTLSFKAKADIARPLVYAMEGDGGVGIPNVKKIVDLTEEWQLVTYTFEITKDGIYDNRRLEFWFGNMANEDGYTAAANVLTKVYIKEVMIGDLALVPDLGGVVNGDFSNELLGWSTWVNDSQDVAADFSVVNGEAVINITEQSILKDNNWWDIQIKQNKVSFDAFQSLKLVFTARAENPRKMMLNLQYGGMAEKAIADELISLTTENQTFEIEFFSKTDAVNAELQFALGTFHKVDGVPLAEQVVLGKVYLSNVKIVAGPALENQAPVLSIKNALIKPDANEFNFLAGIVVDDDFDFLDADDVVIEDVSDVKFVLPAVAGVYKFTYSVTDSGDLTTVVERFIVVKDAFEVPLLENPDINGVPEGWELWHEDTRGGLEAETANGETKLTITKVDNNGFIWDNQFKVTKLAAYKGNYILYFSAKADDARPIVVAMEGAGGVGIPNVTFVRNLTNDYQEFALGFSIENDAIYDDRNLQFWFGNMGDNIAGYDNTANILTNVYLKDIRIEPVEFDELRTINFIAIGAPINNDGDPKASAEYKEDGTVEVNYLGGAGWASYSKFKYTNLALDKDSVYRVIVEVKAEVARDIAIYFVGAGNVPISAEFNVAAGKMIMPIPEEYITYELIFKPVVAGPYNLEIQFGWESFLRKSGDANVITFKQILLIPESDGIDYITDAAIAYDLSTLQLAGTGQTDPAYWETVFANELLDSIPTIARLYDGNGDGGTYPNTPGMIKMGTTNDDGVILFKFDDDVLMKTVVLYIEGWDNNDKLLVNGIENNLSATKTYGQRIVVELAEATNVVEIRTIKRGFLFALEFYGPEATVRVPVDLTISFDYGYDSLVDALSVEKNRRVYEPRNIKRFGYKFLGWFADLADAAPFDFAAVMTEDKTFYAKWEEDPYTMVDAFFGEGRDGLEAMGWEQNGLGTDYGGDPKLKFDHTGDYIKSPIFALTGKADVSIWYKSNSIAGASKVIIYDQDDNVIHEFDSFVASGQLGYIDFVIEANVTQLKILYTKGSGNMAVGSVTVILQH